MIALIVLIAAVVVVGGGVEVLRRARFGTGPSAAHHRALDTLGHIATQSNDPKTDLVADEEPRVLSHVRRAVEADRAQPRIEPRPLSRPVGVPAITGGPNFVGTVPSGQVPGRGPDTEIEGVRLLIPDPPEVAPDADGPDAEHHTIDLDSDGLDADRAVGGDAQGHPDESGAELPSTHAGSGDPEVQRGPLDEDGWEDDEEWAARSGEVAAVDAHGPGDDDAGPLPWAGVAGWDVVSGGDGLIDPFSAFAGAASLDEQTIVLDNPIAAFDDAAGPPAEDGPVDETVAADPDLPDHDEPPTAEHPATELPAAEHPAPAIHDEPPASWPADERPEPNGGPEPLDADTGATRLIHIDDVDDVGWHRGPSSDDTPALTGSGEGRGWHPSDPDALPVAPTGAGPAPAVERGADDPTSAATDDQADRDDDPDGAAVIDDPATDDPATDDPVVLHFDDLGAATTSDPDEAPELRPRQDHIAAGPGRHSGAIPGLTPDETRAQLAALAQSGGMGATPSPARRHRRRRPTHREGLSTSRLSSALMILVAVVVLGGAMFLVAHGSSGGGAKHVSEAAPPATAGPTTTAAPPASLVSQTSSTATYQVSGSPSIDLSFNSSCWTMARQGSSSGPVLFEGLQSAGTSRTLTGPVWVRLGNPTAVSISVGGSSVDQPTVTAGNPFNLQFN